MDMKIERVISCFDEKTGKIQQEHNIDHINFEVLKKIFHPLDDDPLISRLVTYATVRQKRSGKS